MWALSTPWWEIILRVALIYGGLLLLVRLTGKRQIGQLTPMDLLTVLLVSEIVSPALTADESSVPGALLAAATLFAIALLIARVSFRWPGVERFLEGEPRVLISRGKLDHDVMKAERLSQQDLNLALREHGVTSVEEVWLGVLEPTGSITIVEQKPGHSEG